MHPILAVQEALVTALRAEGLVVFDAPPKGVAGAYVVVAQHDVIQRDGDLAPGQEHRVVLHCWAGEPSRQLAVGLAERVVGQAVALEPVGLLVSLARHVRTETVIDGKTGRARAAVTLRYFTEAA